MEKRRFPRRSVSEESELSAKLILSGGSLLNTTSPRSIEIGARPIDLSQGGICLKLKLDVPWETLTPKKQVYLVINSGASGWLLTATVIHHEKDHRTIGLQFAEPLQSLIPFLTPKELQP